MGSLVRFWIDLIFGDTWEVGAGLAITLIAVSILADRTGGEMVLGFVLLAGVLLCNGIALWRATAKTR